MTDYNLRKSSKDLSSVDDKSSSDSNQSDRNSEKLINDFYNLHQPTMLDQDKLPPIKGAVNSKRVGTVVNKSVSKLQDLE